MEDTERLLRLAEQVSKLTAEVKQLSEPQAPNALPLDERMEVLKWAMDHSVITEGDWEPIYHRMVAVLEGREEEKKPAPEKEPLHVTFSYEMPTGVWFIGSPGIEPEKEKPAPQEAPYYPYTANDLLSRMGDFIEILRGEVSRATQSE